MQSESNGIKFESSIQIPVEVFPRLPGGGVHRLNANSEMVQIATWQGVYGNRESRAILTIPFSKVVEITSVRPPLWPVTTCRIRYRKEEDKERVFKFRVFVQASHDGAVKTEDQNLEHAYTEAAAKALEDLRQSKKTAFPALGFRPPTSMRKLLTAGILFGSMILLVSLQAGDGFASLGISLKLLGSLLFSASLPALGIDYVRIHTGWHPVIKVSIYVILTLIAPVLFSILGFLFFEVLI